MDCGGVVCDGDHEDGGAVEHVTMVVMLDVRLVWMMVLAMVAKAFSACSYAVFLRCHISCGLRSLARLGHGARVLTPPQVFAIEHVLLPTAHLRYTATLHGLFVTTVHVLLPIDQFHGVSSHCDKLAICHCTRAAGQ